ncbi:SMI1/KNR4 family protein [Pontibacter sp. HSC-36F09]|uniref:SMI1/KNR4 family protein n=1 Tax=Pontibacter sp. HSC-36F09 TaxID=2910966 RepID=UPI00209D7F33|nr:SMI1/KNR4 family protein [Pontibacter sp. HSC-36F09]MCP2045552.1 cell wall assembly regulator SMI1 [Pontibacter sp. HSC-36F09]
MNELESIWEKPLYLPYIQPPLTAELLEDAEKKIGYKLPNEYIELLKTQNGGYIRKTLPGFEHTLIYGIGPHYPSLTDVDWSEYNDWVSFKLDGLVPFDDDGHLFMCLDYRQDRLNPQIALIAPDSEIQSIVADSFAEYLSKLVVKTDGEFVIETNESIEKVAKDIEQSLGVEFEAPNSYEQGYPIYRSNINGQWMWLSPNLVPKGFVRRDDDRYNELKQLANGEATRFPEVAKSSLLISFSNEETEKRALAKLRESSIAIRPLSEFV